MGRRYNIEGLCSVCGEITMIGAKALRCEPCYKEMDNKRNRETYHRNMEDFDYREKMKALGVKKRQSAEYKKRESELGKARYKKRKNEDSEFMTKRNAAAREKRRNPIYREIYNANARRLKQKYDRLKLIKKNKQSLFALNLQLNMISVLGDEKAVKMIKARIKKDKKNLRIYLLYRKKPYIRNSLYSKIHTKKWEKTQWNMT